MRLIFVRYMNFSLKRICIPKREVAENVCVLPCPGILVFLWRAERTLQFTNYLVTPGLVQNQLRLEFGVPCSAHANRNDHGNVLLVTPVLLAVSIGKITLFELYRHEDVRGGCQRKDEMRQRHRRRGPEREQPAQIKRMPNVTIKHRRPEF